MSKQFKLVLIAVFYSVILTAQNTGTVIGKITDSENFPLEKVQVTLISPKYVTQTNANGEFEFKNITTGNYFIRFSILGYKSKEVSISVFENQTTEIPTEKLLSNSEQLNEIFIETYYNRYTKTESEYVSRMPIKNLENASVYNVVTKELMKDQLITSQDEALKNVPGLYQIWAATGRTGDGGSLFASRGFVTQSLLRNGIAGKITNNVDASNLERLEAIKGPSATLFGSLLTSYGGLINRVTKKPHENFGGEISYQAGSYGLNRITADVNTALNSDQTALLRVNGAYNNSNTFQDFGKTRSFFVAPSFIYKVNDRFTLSIDAELSNVDASSMPLVYLHWGQTPSTLGLSNASEIQMDWKRSFTGGEFMMNTKTANVFAQADYIINDNWKSSTVFSTSSNQSFGPQTWFYLLPNNTMERNVWNIDGRDNIVEFQQNFNGEFNVLGLKNRFLAGGDIYRLETKAAIGYLPTFWTFDTINYSGEVPNYYDFNPTNAEALFAQGTQAITHSSLTTYSAYLADVINVTENILLSAALRFDHFENHGIYNPTNNTTSGAFSQNALSPKFGAVIQVLKDQISLFGNYQNSFKNVMNTNPGATETFKPETANQFEAGVKINAFNNRLSASLSYYNINVENIVRASTAPGINVQDGNQTSKGFEAEITSNPIPGLNFIFGFAHNNSKLNKVNDQRVQGLRPETAGPENMINYWVNYSLQDTSLRGLGFGFGGNYGSKNYVYNQNPSADGNPANVETYYLPEYFVMNAALYYDQPKYRFSFKVNNLTDELYFNGGYTTTNVQAPRTFMGSVAYKF
ncbi:TonB-dependent siderophore receptor [Flavobacterium sp. NST-5]|uniref:TonB-dependent siderophore receptor n=1 Tax=Flavobacterium ichthyis TaxID=2698827 RepID=A0ABW9Z5V4_9FLAO|nr:TonB-dependent siderophore receptor [Flavobacterium ichthyis]NBL64217.1 TonB-dependent siderophore receptor [Flavobacterium ichthyis]